MGTKEKTLEEIAKEIAEKVADEFMKSILSRLTSEVVGLRRDVGDLKDSMNRVWEVLERLAKAQERTEERLSELAQAQKETEKRLNKLAEAQKRTEERLNELAQAQKETEKRLNELAEAQKRTEERLNELADIVGSLTGEVSRIRGDLIETRVVMTLSSSLGRRGFDVFYHFPGIPYVDIIVEADGFLALIEVCKRCDIRDVKQVVKGAKIFEEKEGVKPNVLVVFSYTGEVDEDAIEEARKRNIIIEWNTRRLVKKLLELSQNRTRGS